MCAIIPKAQAAAILGGSPTGVTSPNVKSGILVHIDRCNWRTGGASFGYQLDRYVGTVKPATVVAQASAATKSMPGVKKFAVPGPSGVGFVAAAGPKALARVYILVSDKIAIDISAVAAAGAKAQQIALAVATKVLAGAGG